MHSSYGIPMVWFSWVKTMHILPNMELHVKGLCYCSLLRTSFEVSSWYICYTHCFYALVFCTSILGLWCYVDDKLVEKCFHSDHDMQQLSFMILTRGLWTCFWNKKQFKQICSNIQDKNSIQLLQVAFCHTPNMGLCTKWGVGVRIYFSSV